ncbi:MAG TPA: PorV/PorQ family protein [Bacteroidota bacterium]|nr:PorV/PorQ family protein [Bacteroidota bacterium]
MKRIGLVFGTIAILLSLFLSAGYSQTKLAQTGFNFLSVGTDARATGMGEAFTTMEGSAASLFYNPAGLAAVNTFVDASASRMTWIADIKYLSGVASFAPLDGQYGVVGISFMTIDYGEFNFTRVAPNEQGFIDIDGPKPSAYVMGIGYGKQLTNQFSVGGQVKYAYQNLGQSLVPVYTSHIDASTGKQVQDTTNDLRKYTLGTIAFDFGTLYKTGLKSLAFGVSINNFSREVRYERESFQLPLSFKIGVSMNVLDLVPDVGADHSFIVSVDAAHPRSYAEFLNVGGEYVFNKTISLRAGYITHHPDYNFTAGIGVQKFGVGVDYSYMPHKIFSNIQRLSVRFFM